MPVYIDDITILSSSPDAMSQVVELLTAEYKLRDLGPTQFLLGIKIKQDEDTGSISLSQQQYSLDILEPFGIADCNAVTTPMNPGCKLSVQMAPKDDAECEFMMDKPYRNAIGALNYLSTTTCPDISYTVSKLARYSADPGPQHWKALLHLLRSIKRTLDYKLVYRSSPDLEPFLTYSDADHDGDVDTGKSTGGYLVTCGGGAISLSSKLQSIVALSSTEDE